MNRIRTIRTIWRSAVILAGLAGALLAFSAVSPAAFAYRLPPHGGLGGTAGPPPVHTLITGGMPGWQVTLIAAGAAVLAAAGAVRLDRARTARRHLAPGA